MANGELIRTLYSPTYEIKAAAVVVSAQRQLLATGALDTTLSVWDMETGARVLGLEDAHAASIYALTGLGEMRLASGSRDRTVKIWQLHDDDDNGGGGGCGGECVRTLVGHTSHVRSLAHLGDERLVSGSLGEMRVWNWRSGECLSGGGFVGHTSWVQWMSCIQLDEDDDDVANTLVSCSPRELKVWRWTTTTTTTTTSIQVPKCLRTIYRTSYFFNSFEAAAHTARR